MFWPWSSSWSRPSVRVVVSCSSANGWLRWFGSIWSVIVGHLLELGSRSSSRTPDERAAAVPRRLAGVFRPCEGWTTHKDRHERPARARLPPHRRHQRLHRLPRGRRARSRAGHPGRPRGLELDPAQDLPAGLVSTVVASLRPMLRLAKLEGDAAFAYVVTPTI